jgi:hypothetical protein
MPNLSHIINQNLGILPEEKKEFFLDELKSEEKLIILLQRLKENNFTDADFSELVKLTEEISSFAFDLRNLKKIKSDFLYKFASLCENIMDKRTFEFLKKHVSTRSIDKNLFDDFIS